MKIGISAAYYDWSLKKICYEALKAGFDGVEVDLLKQAGEFITSTNLPILSVHAPAIINVQRLQQSAWIAKKMGVKLVVCHPGIRPATFLLLRWYWKLQNVTLAIENIPPLDIAKIYAAGGNADYVLPFETVWDRYKGPVVFDIGHFWRLVNWPQEKTHIAYWLKIVQMGQRIVHVHYHDCLGHTDHLPPGKGDLNFIEFFNALKEINFQGSVILEARVNDLKAEATRLRAFAE